MYAANWMYGTHISVQDVRRWSRENVPSLELTDGDISLLKGVDYDIMTQNLIGLIRILIPIRYAFFLEAYLQRTPGSLILESC
jgi:hypothetical protein